MNLFTLNQFYKVSNHIPYLFHLNPSIDIRNKAEIRKITLILKYIKKLPLWNSRYLRRITPFQISDTC